MQNDIIPISPGQTFPFSCSRQNSCFNGCCRDLNQFLTPYDILRLKDRLGLSSHDFLTSHTSKHTGPESGLPVIVLKPNADRSAVCPFVTTAGCSVYEDRPSSCRMYPLIRVVSRSRETAELGEHFMLLKERHCRGFQDGASWTAAMWQAAQGLGIYNEMNDLMLDIISLKNRRAAGPLDVNSRRLFCLALYDLDSFRAHILEKDLPQIFTIPAEAQEHIANDDEALLRFGFSWIRQVLFKD